jgi:hypothetical protein
MAADCRAGKIMMALASEVIGRILRAHTKAASTAALGALKRICVPNDDRMDKHVHPCNAFVSAKTTY